MLSKIRKNKSKWTGLDKAIFTRRSIRLMDPEQKVPKEHIEEMVQVGNWAPTACNKQGVKFYCLTSREKIASISSAFKNDPKNAGLVKSFSESKQDVLPILHNAPLVIFVYVDPVNDGVVKYDGAMAAQNIVLKAAELGYGMCIVGLAEQAKDFISKIVKPGDKEQYCLAICIGKPKDGKFPDDAVFKWKGADPKRKAPAVKIIE